MVKSARIYGMCVRIWETARRTLIYGLRRPLIPLIVLFLLCSVTWFLTLHILWDRESVDKVSEATMLYDRVSYMSDMINRRASILNDDTLPPLEENYVPIVIYVFQRADMLSQMLTYLRNVTDIEKTMLIISHDGIFPAVADVVESIDFVRVKQLIHPYPARARGDIFQLKAHWMWLMDQVWGKFYGTLVPKDGFVLFLEEDHAVSPDIYVMMKALIRTMLREKHPDVWGISMNRYWSEPKEPWASDYLAGHSNTGYVFNRTFYEALDQHRDFVTTFMDGWDWMVFGMMQRRWLPEVHIAPRLSRIRNLGHTGITMSPEAYEESGLGRTPVSTEIQVDESQLELFTDVLGYPPSTAVLYVSPWEKRWVTKDSV